MGIETNYNSATSFLTSEEHEASKAAEQQVNDELGRDAFLTLFTAQLQNQNPLDPMQNEAFVSQLAQFSSLESMQSMDSSIQAMTEGMQTDRFLLGTNLLGTRLDVEGGNAQLSGASNAKGYAMLPDYAELLNFSVNDSSGKKVFEAELKNTNSGRLDLEWDGLDTQGKRLSDGSYKFMLTKVDGEKAISIPVKTSQIVQSVNWNKSKNEMQVEISDGRLLPMPDLDKIAY